MPFTGDNAKKTSEPQSPSQGLLAKCGRFFPSLSVRARRSSEASPNKPVMTADPNFKRRKISNNNLRSSARTEIKMAAGYTATISEPPVEDAEFASIKKRVALGLDSALVDIKNSGGCREARNNLIKAETENAWDSHVAQFSPPIEKKAALIVKILREYERRVVFGNNASEAIPDRIHTRDMGGQFLTNREWIETKSKIFEVAKNVPKGGLLHLHFNAELAPEHLLVQARKTDNMYVYSMRPLKTYQALEETEMMFKVLPNNTKSSNIFSSEYQGGGDSWKKPDLNNTVWMKWKDFMSKFEREFPKIKGRAAVKARSCSEKSLEKLSPAENWILQKMVLSEKEAYDPEQTVNGVWARFNQATRCFKGLVNYQKVYEWYIDNAIDELIKEKVMYAELRPMLLDKSIPTDDGTRQLSNATQMKIITERVAKKKAELEALGKSDQFPFGLKIIYCTPRSIPKPLMLNEMKECLALKTQYPDLICGFDLVGAEDRRNHIGYYIDELSAFQKYCKQNETEIPFLFHAGETLLDTGGSTDPNNSNLYDAVALGAKRVGHGYSLMKHPHLIEKFKKTALSMGICIEVCPISNELLHLCRNAKEHPYPQLLAAGIPCTINSDNPSLFSNSMSHEFYQVMVGAPSMSIYSWKQLALWSIEYSCLNSEQKEEGKRIFMKTWETFCHYVVKEFGHLIKEAEVDEHGDEVTAERKEKQVQIVGTDSVIDEDKAREFYDGKSGGAAS